jgi:hypothetical protein
MGNKPAVFQQNVVCTNIHCCPFILILNTSFTLSWPQYNSGPHRTWCNCLQFDFWIICCCPGNQWQTDQDGQCTCNVILWHIHVTCCCGQAVHILNVCLYSSHSYPACKVYVPFYNVICDLSGCMIFYHIISYMVWFLGKAIEHKMCILIFYTTSERKMSHSKKNSARYYHKCTYFHVQYQLFLSGFNETW